MNGWIAKALGIIPRVSHKREAEALRIALDQAHKLRAEAERKILEMEGIAALRRRNVDRLRENIETLMDERGRARAAHRQAENRFDRVTADLMTVTKERDAALARLSRKPKKAAV